MDNSAIIISDSSLQDRETEQTYFANLWLDTGDLASECVWGGEKSMFRGIEYIAININILSSDTQCKQKVVDGMLKGLLSSVGLLSYYSFSKNYSVCMLCCVNSIYPNVGT